MPTYDLGPAAQSLATLIREVRDEQLTSPTPCQRYRLGDLIDHVSGLSNGLAAAARKDFDGGAGTAPSGDAARLDSDWRTSIPPQLDALARAWRTDGAWEGMTKAGGIDLPAEIAGRVALNELVVHGWDIARATGQSFRPALADLEMSQELLSSDLGSRDSEGPFGPTHPVPEDAPLLDRVIGLSGRDPHWTAG